MALDFKGTKNSLSTNEKPSGYSDPVVVSFEDQEATYDLSLTVLKATVETATGAATMAAIIANATIGISKQCTDIVNNDYDTANTVDAYADWIGLTHNLAAINGSGDYLKNTAMSYVCTVKLYIKTS